MTTLNERLSDANDRPSGFDYIRLILAIGVIAMHSVIVCYGQLAEIEFWNSPARPFIRMILPMFFALSGFLVAGSLVRSRTTLMFLTLRVIRIFPALCIEVLISAILLGSIFTSVSIREYYSHPQFYAYFWNLVGHVQFSLPGVFGRNPNPGVVNGQVWTIPYELYCYLILVPLTLVGAVIYRWIVPLVAVLLTIAYVTFQYLYRGIVPVKVTGPMPGVLLVVCFLVGVGIFLYRHKLQFSLPAAAVSLLFALATVAFLPYGDYLAPWAIAYLTVHVGLLNPRRTFFVIGADYSYGLFLYGYPIQQALATYEGWPRIWYPNIIATVVLGLIFASLSWHVVERRALGLRHPFRLLEEKWLNRKFSRPAGLPISPPA